jgi:hypothetical protein
MKSTPTRNVPLEESIPGDDAGETMSSSIPVGRSLMLLVLLLFAAAGCSRFVDLDDQDRLETSSSSCISCHTNEAIMIAMLGEVVPGDEGGGGG